MKRRPRRPPGAERPAAAGPDLLLLSEALPSLIEAARRRIETIRRTAAEAPPVAAGFGASPRALGLLADRSGIGRPTERWWNAAGGYLALLRDGEPPIRPFLIVTPAGFDRRALLRGLLGRAGVEVLRIESVADWPLAATPLYVRRPTVDRIIRAVGHEAAWNRLFPDPRAERWELDEASYRCLIAAKPSLRRALGIISKRVLIGDRPVEVRLHPFHVPDPADLETEARLLNLWTSRAPTRR